MDLDTKFAIFSNTRSARTELNEFCQKHRVPIPIYTQLQKLGPDHKPTFVVEVTIGGLNAFVTATGNSKKDADENTAKKCMQKIEHMGIEEFLLQIHQKSL